MRQNAKTRERYRALIVQYTHKREQLRKQHGKKLKYPKPNPAYAAAVKPINNQLTWFRRAIKRIDQRQMALKEIANHIENFTGIDVRYSIRRNYYKENYHREKTMARNLFYKYALEHGFSSPDIMYFVGGRHRYWATHARRKFTKSFSTNPGSYAVWTKFMEYMIKTKHHKTQLV